MSSSTSSEVVVEAKNLGKAFQLYAHRNDWLKQVLFGWWKAYFKPFWVLRDISLEVRKGESIGILGRNGCGKSTLLQVVCGMTLPSHGELRVSGRIAPVLALGSTFDMELSGRENVLIGGAVLGLKRSEVLRKFDSIAEFAGIGEYMDQPVKHYSMGMRTRLAFSICAHVEADILVVDEALSVGDAAFQRKCLDWIDNSARQGRCSSCPIRWPRSAACARARSGSRKGASASRATPTTSSAPITAPCWSKRTTSSAFPPETPRPEVPSRSPRASDRRWSPGPWCGSASAGGRSVRRYSGQVPRWRVGRDGRTPPLIGPVTSPSWRPWPVPKTPRRPMSRLCGGWRRLGLRC